MNHRKLRALAGCGCLLAALLSGGGHAAESGTAIVTRGEETYRFLVIQCQRDLKAIFGDTFIEFQLDGVPEGTPAEQVSGLLGGVEAGENFQALVRPVVEHGPILSITRVQGGGDQVAVTDMDQLMWVSDGSPLHTASRVLEISDGTGARVSGSVTVGGETMSVEASCPG